MKKFFILAYTILLAFMSISCSPAEEKPTEVKFEDISSTSEAIVETTTEGLETTTVEIMTIETTTEAHKSFYPLTDKERDTIERVVMAEAGGEFHVGQVAIAQCILNACMKLDMRPIEVIEYYQYTSYRPAPSEPVKVAVSSVFDKGRKVIDEEVLWFYAPAHCTSEWHESQVYVCTIGAHKFFKER
jgi:spore germination cell wall hydrolase CwlJ-like protein